MRLALLGDGESPHLLKWARALAAQPRIELFAVSSRGFLPGFEAVLEPARRLALGTSPRTGGGNAALLATLPRVARWLGTVSPDWLHAHYLTSHGTLAAAARRVAGLRARLVGSAWGSDILVTPERGWPWRALTRSVLRACALTTSDSQAMAARMRTLGAREVMVFPFGLEALPPLPPDKDVDLAFANRGLEPIYRPERVLDVFAALRAWRPSLRLVVANEGSRRDAMRASAAARGLADAVRFVGRLDATVQDAVYARAQWYLSLPASDSVSVSVLEAMAHGAIPIVSDLPANRELVRAGDNGLVLGDAQWPDAATLHALFARRAAVAERNRAWVEAEALFGPAVARFVARLEAIDAARDRVPHRGAPA